MSGKPPGVGALPVGNVLATQIASGGVVLIMETCAFLEQIDGGLVQSYCDKF